VLDVGTDNLQLLNDDMYLGVRHARVRDQRYDDLIDAYVTAVTKLFPNAMLHWEDFGTRNARRILERYAEHVCTFNDDMQGTAAVVLAGAFAAVKAAGTRMRDQRVVIHGAGTAGIGIADMMRDQMVREGLSREEATRRFWPLGRAGLLTDDRADKLYDFQVPYARPASEVAGWASPGSPGITLADVVARAHPTILIGTSTQRGAFTEAIVRDMAQHVTRPIIMPLSNPTSNCEALPEDLIRWTEGRAMIATGSPFGPVVHGDVRHQIGQANNALVFPGIGLGVVVARASRITDRMIAAAADAVAQLSDASTLGAPLLPPVDDLRRVSAAVGVAVAVAAAEEGVAQTPVTEPIQQVHEAMWRPEYPRIEVV
jgi:malate dehydrogenase (oxaloacetate-decarboxylating)